MTFENLDVGSSFFAYPVDSIFRGYGSGSGHWVKVEVTGAKRFKKLFSQCTTSIGNNSGSIEHRAIKFAFSTGFSATADRVM